MKNSAPIQAPPNLTIRQRLKLVNFFALWVGILDILYTYCVQWSAAFRESQLTSTGQPQAIYFSSEWLPSFIAGFIVWYLISLVCGYVISLIFRRKKPLWIFFSVTGVIISITIIIVGLSQTCGFQGCRTFLPDLVPVDFQE